MKNNRVSKGKYGYISYQRRVVMLRTLLLFTLSLIIFASGLWYYKGDKKNLLTVIAILGCLPACKSAVNMIMFFRAKGCSAQLHEQLSACTEGLCELYDMFFTSYSKNFQISHLAIKNNIICGFSENPSCDTAACEKHLDSVLKQGGCKNITVKIYDSLTAYCEGLHNLKQHDKDLQPDITQTETIIENLLSVSL